jgi:hypothetical protein
VGIRFLGDGAGEDGDDRVEVGDGGAVEDKGEAGAVDDGGDGTGLQAAIANPNKSQEREKPLNFIALT